MSASPIGSQTREQEERVMIFMALALGLILIALLFAWFSPGAVPVLVPSVWGGRPSAGPVVFDGPEELVLPEVPAVVARTGGTAAEVAARASSARLALLESDNAELRARLAQQEQKLAGWVPASDLAAMEREMNVLKDLVVELNGTNKRHEARASEGAGELAAARGEVERLKASEAKLRGLSREEGVALQKARADLGKLQTRLAAAEKDREAAVAELERMILRQKTAPAVPVTPAMPPDTVSPAVPAVPGDELPRLRKELEAAQDRIRGLEEQLKKQSATRQEGRTDAFRRSSDWTVLPAEAVQPGDLWIGAVPLFQTLKLSTHAREAVEVRDAYVQSNRLGTLVARIHFDDAEAQPGPGATAALNRAVSGIAPNAYLLAVGYASVKGQSGYNDGLSSRRAQAVADLVRPVVRDGKVQMVFFGETSQFDPGDLSKNRVVELWRIDP